MNTFYNPTPTNFYDDYISHHGILGMKWGKQNGPPYPLGSGDHSKSERSAGWKKSLGGGRNEEMYDRKKKKTSSSTSTTVPKNKSSRLTKEESEAVKKQSDPNKSTENWNKSSTYSKDFLEYISWQVGSPETVDDPELLSLLEMEYEAGTGKSARKDGNFILSDEAAKKYGVSKNNISKDFNSSEKVKLNEKEQKLKKQQKNLKKKH